MFGPLRRKDPLGKENGALRAQTPARVTRGVWSGRVDRGAAARRDGAQMTAGVGHHLVACGTRAGTVTPATLVRAAVLAGADARPVERAAAKGNLRPGANETGEMR